MLQIYIKQETKFLLILYLLFTFLRVDKKKRILN